MSLFRLACNLLIGTTPTLFSEYYSKSLSPDYTQTYTASCIQDPLLAFFKSNISRTSSYVMFLQFLMYNILSNFQYRKCLD